jgi:hypothetical protein
MEYTITTPLFSAIMLATVAPTVPTGMVQWLFVCLVASHLLCIPILYMSHFSMNHDQNNGIQLHKSAIHLAIGLLLAAVVALQIMAFVVKFLYITASLDYYSVSGVLQGAVWFLLVMQILFVLTVLCVSVCSMIGDGTSEFFKTVAKVSSYLYTFINLLIKFVVGILLLISASNDYFPVPSCDVWEGKYAPPDPSRML